MVCSSCDDGAIFLRSETCVKRKLEDDGIRLTAVNGLSAHRLHKVLDQNDLDAYYAVRESRWGQA
jgi:hypothetical protein